MAEDLSKPEKVKIAKPAFKPLSPGELPASEVQFRRVSVPAHRYAPLKKAWLSDPPDKFDIYHLVYEEMKIDICMRLKKREILLKTRPDTPDISHLQKCYEFLDAFMLGFDTRDAATLCMCDGVYLLCFSTDDVKNLKGEHLARAIGRICGKAGKTKNVIENATNTKIVIAEKNIRILGQQANIGVAKYAICSLILGSPASKVYSKLRAVTARLAERC
ncbi:uncharacterized protein LOC141597314 [Silene latifolia]|uniref:uncharacterized protein LOC141597314 n=1 Tax=Silene latifolia TaxID=37657 RepID=UPI003D7774B2